MSELSFCNIIDYFSWRLLVLEENSCTSSSTSNRTRHSILHRIKEQQVKWEQSLVSSSCSIHPLSSFVYLGNIQGNGRWMVPFQYATKTCHGDVPERWHMPISNNRNACLLVAFLQETIRIMRVLSSCRQKSRSSPRYQELNPDTYPTEEPDDTQGAIRFVNVYH